MVRRAGVCLSISIIMEKLTMEGGGLRYEVSQ